MRIFVFIAVLALAAALAWVRLAPLRPDRWHVEPASVSVSDIGGHRVRLEFAGREPRAVLEALDEVAGETPRTERLAGSAEEGRITWVTRSRLLGFPDLTTAQAAGAEGGTQLHIVARQRFGKGDMGVNRARLEAWSAQLQAAIDRD